MDKNSNLVVYRYCFLIKCRKGAYLNAALGLVKFIHVTVKT